MATGGDLRDDAPVAECRSAWEETTEESTWPSSVTTAAAVSSQDVSSARITTFLVGDPWPPPPPRPPRIDAFSSVAPPAT